MNPNVETEWQRVDFPTGGVSFCPQTMLKSIKNLTQIE